MTNRIEKLCSYLDPCESFADVGCDHGYCTLYMLKNGLCKSAVISDVSAKCLSKAEKLLSRYIVEGAVKSVCCNGLEKIDKRTQQILIAGMGGDEIISIFQNSYIPESFVLQPMHNARKVREYLLQNGAVITEDSPFESGGKIYFVIKGKKSGVLRPYTQAELAFGQALENPVTAEYMRGELKKNAEYLRGNLNRTSRLQIEARINFINGVLNGEIK